jgi:HK97 gp10 family phage protein
MNIQVKIKNIDEIRAAFNKAPLKMKKNLAIAIRRATIEIQKEEIINVSGTRGINVVTSGLKSAAVRGIQFPSPLMGVVQPDIEYAAFVHDGTRFMRARPFLADAVQTKEDAVSKEFEKAVQDTLDEIGREV